MEISQKKHIKTSKRLEFPPGKKRNSESTIGKQTLQKLLHLIIYLGFSRELVEVQNIKRPKKSFNILKYAALS